MNKEELQSSITKKTETLKIKNKALDILKSKVSLKAQEKIKKGKLEEEKKTLEKDIGELKLKVQALELQELKNLEVKIQVDTTKNDTLKLKYDRYKIESPDDIKHKEIAGMNIDSILATYGQEKWMELVNEHTLIEINKLRIAKQLVPLEISHDVMVSSQKQAEFLDKLWKTQHMAWDLVLPKRLERENIVFSICWENLADGQTNIAQVVEHWRTLSETHKENLLNPKFKKIWLGYAAWKRVYIAIG